MYIRKAVLAPLLALLVLVAMVGSASGFPVITETNVDLLVKVADLAIPHGVVRVVSFTPDGINMITGNVDGEVLVWDTPTWAYRVLAPQQQELTLLHASTVKTQHPNVHAVSPDGRLIVTSNADDEGTVVVRARTGQELFAFVFGAPVFEILFSPDGTRMAIGGLRTTIQVFDVATWSLVAELTGSHEYVSNLLFSEDGKTLIASYERPTNVIKTWDLTTFSEITTFSHVTERIDYHALVHAPNGREIVLSTTEEDEIHFIDLETHNVTREWDHDPNAPYELAFSADGSLLVSASDRMLFWDVARGVVVRTVTSMSTEAGTVAFSPDGTLLFLTVWEEGIQIWAVAP
jgi:DNA-binding beta-propeller fold protein YncE